jgi:large subunit ribosomal protein L13
MGGAKTKSLQKMMDDTPEEVILKAVRGMLPKTRLGRQMIKKLKIYRGATHPHVSQGPRPVTLTRTSEALAASSDS